MLQLSLWDSSPAGADTQYLSLQCQGCWFEQHWTTKEKTNLDLTIRVPQTRSGSGLLPEESSALKNPVTDCCLPLSPVFFHPSSHLFSNEQFGNCLINACLRQTTCTEVDLFSTSRLPVYLDQSCCTTYLNHDFSYPSPQLKLQFLHWLRHRSLWPWQVQSCLSCIIQNTTAKIVSLTSFFSLLVVFKQQLLFYYQLDSLILIPMASQFSSSLILQRCSVLITLRCLIVTFPSSLPRFPRWLADP